MFIFESSLESGQRGEEDFLRHFPRHMKRLDGLVHDFVYRDKYYIELKSDYYDMNQTPNFFMERYSDKSRRTLGGPWQAQKNGNHFYVYYFPLNGVYFIFKTDELVSRLDEIRRGMILIDIPNRSWITQGYKIFREDLKDIYRIKNINNEQ